MSTSRELAGLHEAHFGSNDTEIRGQIDFEHAEAKAIERNLVYEFLCATFSPSEEIRLLSLPGTSWLLENRLVSSRPNTHCIGLERAVGTFHRSKPCLPGRGDFADRILNVGPVTLDYVCRSALGRDSNTRVHRLLHCDFSDFASVLQGEFPLSGAQRSKIVNKFCHRNAMWIDINGNLSARFLKAMPALPEMMDSFGTHRAVVLTVAYGRDWPGRILGRVGILQRLCPRLKVESTRMYRGLRGTRMLTLFCHLVSPRIG